MELSTLKHCPSITRKAYSGWVAGETRDQREVDAFCVALSTLDGCRLSERRSELTMVRLPSGYHSWRVFHATTGEEICSGWGSGRTNFNAFSIVLQIAFDLRFRTDAWRSTMQASEPMHEGVLDLMIDADLTPRPIGEHGLPDYSDFMTRPFGWNAAGEV